SVNIALQDAGYPLKRGVTKVADSKLDAFIAANTELALNADTVRAGEKETMPAAKLVEGKLLTADETNGVTDMAVYNIANGG
ncbi:MFS transporter, partial [Rhizobium johnstonii]